MFRYGDKSLIVTLLSFSIVTISDIHCTWYLFGHNLLTYRSKTTLFVDPLTLSAAILASLTQLKMDKLRVKMCKAGQRSPKIRQDVKICMQRYWKGKAACTDVGGRKEVRLPAPARPYRAFYAGREGRRQGCGLAGTLYTPAFAGCGMNCIRYVLLVLQTC